MDGQIRVRTEVRHREIYNNMKSHQVIGDFHQLFFACACLGYQRGKRRRLTRGDERFWSRTITPQEWACFYAMVLEQGVMDFSCLVDDKAVLAAIEEYANAGMEILMDEFLGDFLLASSKNEPQLDPAQVKELPKHFVGYLYEQSSAPV